MNTSNVSCSRRRRTVTVSGAYRTDSKTGTLVFDMAVEVNASESAVEKQARSEARNRVATTLSAPVANVQILDVDIDE